MLKHTEDRSKEDAKQLIQFRSKRNLYFSASVVLAVVLIALGIVREFIIAGGTTVNLWIMLVTVGLAIIVAIALGLQGAEVTEIIHKYRRMIKWQRLKYRIDSTERSIREGLDKIHRKIEEEINLEWNWMNYLKLWLLREFDDNDRDKSEQEKQQLVYTNFSLFKQKLLDQSERTLTALDEYEAKYKELVNFDYQKFIQEKA